MNNTMVQALVKPLLIRWHDVEWSIQGLGMLRTYLDKDRKFRLHIWHSKLRVKDVSAIHDHPWDFESYVVAGQIQNMRYRLHQNGEPHQHVQIECGPGTTAANMISTYDTQKLKVTHDSPEIIHPGHSYFQYADDIHQTFALDGTITICDRKLVRQDNHAHVYWESGPWVSAEPRPATLNEVEFMVKEALKLL